MPPPANLAKAYLKIEGGEKVDCWFNPTEYSIQKSNSWSVDSVVGEEVPPAQFGGGQPSKLTVELMFDDSDGEHGDVRKATDPLFAAMEVDQSRATEKNSGRPPTIEFGWGTATTFKAVIESLSVQFTMFKGDGTPIRASASLSLMQVEKAVGKSKSSGERSQNPTTRGTRGLRNHTVRDGDSIQSIAYSAYGDATRWRAIAEANDIDDPLSVTRGTVLSIPPITD